MGQVLAINDLGRAFGGVEDKPDTAVTPAMRTESSDVSSKLVAPRCDAIGSLKCRKHVATVLTQGVHHPGNRAELVRIGLAVVDQRLFEAGGGVDAGQTG